MFVKSFIYLTIIAIIATSSNAGLAQAKSYSKENKLSNTAVSPENPSELETPFSRVRRGIERQRAADENDIPKDQLYTGSALRFRRQTAPGESDVPTELQNERAKRQIPSPPGEMPMPPI